MLGGISRFLQPGWTVLIKPNLLIGASPEKCVNTHPEVVKAVVKLVKEAGCSPIMGDSPAVGKGSFHARLAGYHQICAEMDVPWVDLEDNSVEVEGKVTFRRLTIARPVLEVDAIINLPKIKTHGQTYLTLAVKNMFGLVPGVRKTRWHLTAGRETEFFCRMLVEVCYLRKPVLNIVDGVIAMQGNGPRAGDPFDLGYILAGEDPSAVDRVICGMLRVKPSKLPTLSAAEKMGLGETRIENIEVLGDNISEARVKGFRFGGQHSPADLGTIGKLVPLVKKGITSQPKVDHEICTRCGECVEHCPAKAMSLSPESRRNGEKIKTDLDLCIRCYCCSEVCPEGAISVKQGWMWRLVPGFLR